MSSKKIIKQCIVIEDGADLRKTHFRFDPGTELLFCLGSSLSYLKLKLMTNYPLKNVEFSRYKFQHISFQYNPSNGPFSTEAISMNQIANIHIALPGAYKFIILDDSESISEKILKSTIEENLPFQSPIRCVGCFVVDPKIRIVNGINLSIDQINIQTVLSRCLGPVKEWPERLKVTLECGYNSVHFTPYQKYGKSGSCFSINDHFSVDPSIIDRSNNEQFSNVIKNLKTKFNCLIVDLVLNHTSHDCPLIKSHPEAFYNLQNSPFLKPAFIIDRSLFYLTASLIKKFGKVFQLSDDDLKCLKDFVTDFVTRCRLIEFFIIDIEKTISQFKKYLEERKYEEINHTNNEVEIIQDSLYRRLCSTIDFGSAFNKYFGNSAIDKNKIETISSNLRDHLRYLNQKKLDHINNIQNEIINNCVSTLFYMFIDKNGPKRTSISLEDPLFTPYFSIHAKEYTPVSLDMDGIIAESDNAKFIVAHQGWIINSSTWDFCNQKSEVYIRRQLIPWGDCVKIRWTKTKEESPFIWDYMTKYALSLATNFDGLRIDNCHSTPIHVLEYIVDSCRAKNPDLILIGELFTSSEHEDNLFVNSVGLTCLIRERMSAPNLTELCHILHRFTGNPIGSFIKNESEYILASPKLPRAALMDMTHDNKCMFTHFSPLEYVSTSGFMSLAACPIGSVRGFDEMIPFHINVLEKRQYTSWNSLNQENNKGPINTNEMIKRLNEKGKTCCEQGIIHLKKILNKLHHRLDFEGYNEIYIDKKSPSIATVTRYNPNKNVGYVSISNHCFENHNSQKILKIDEKNQKSIFPISTGWDHPEICIPGLIEEIFVEAFMYKFEEDKEIENAKFLNGSTEYFVEIYKNLKVSESKMIDVRVVEENDKFNVKSYIGLSKFPAGSIIILKTKLCEDVLDTIKSIRSYVFDIQLECHKISDKKTTSCEKYLKNFTFSDVNNLLFKCQEEELEDGKSTIYSIPHYGNLIYQGLYGLEIIFSKCRLNNDLGHPICHNLRDGNWLLDHYINRTKNISSSQEFSLFFENLINLCKNLPRYLIPSYFDICIKNTINLIVTFVFSKLNPKLITYDNFTRKLLLSSFAVVGKSENIKLPKFNSESIKNLPPFIDEEITISAGLSHFCTSWKRLWGRDIFLSLPGLLIIPGRLIEAKIIILNIASTYRHGLIPNLVTNLAESPRYNSRDSIWFFIYSIKQYVKATNDFSILNEKINLVFANDDGDRTKTEKMTLTEIIFDSIQKHFNTIDFIEKNAGEKIDRMMKTDGFHVTCGIDKTTGFVYGGNRWNCGTWMDKMGSSEKANNKGFPATPRDGSAIEIVALFSSILSWLEDLCDKNKFTFQGVIDENKDLILWKELNHLIKNNFEKYFWIPQDISEAKRKFNQDSSIINKTGIYKDSVNSSLKYTDYQLRPNLLIAMVVAPYLFTAKNAILCLETIHSKLEGKYGMRTLDSSDWSYFGYYNNSEDSDRFNTSGGFNYHLGPEWLWLTGYYIRALQHFSKIQENSKDFDRTIRSILSRLNNLEQSNDWLGLPELTQENGIFCPDSCRTQAWSIGCIIEAIKDFSISHPNH